MYATPKLYLLVLYTMLIIPVNRGVATTNCTVFNAHTYAKRTPKPNFFLNICALSILKWEIYIFPKISHCIPVTKTWNFAITKLNKFVGRLKYLKSNKTIQCQSWAFFMEIDIRCYYLEQRCTLHGIAFSWTRTIYYLYTNNYLLSMTSTESA